MPITLTRQQLHDRAWTTPLETLVKELAAIGLVSSAPIALIDATEKNEPAVLSAIRNRPTKVTLVDP